MIHILFCAVLDGRSRTTQNRMAIPRKGVIFILPTKEVILTLLKRKLENSAEIKKKPESISLPDLFFATHSQLWLGGH